MRTREEVEGLALIPATVRFPGYACLIGIDRILLGSLRFAESNRPRSTRKHLVCLIPVLRLFLLVKPVRMDYPCPRQVSSPDVLRSGVRRNPDNGIEILCRWSFHGLISTQRARVKLRRLTNCLSTNHAAVSLNALLGRRACFTC